ncbi:MAG: ABC transporter ATP-binding protein [Elusimicrobia bacterium]|nr:ABC transporter ATP-binding protein [Elusimicrobiota bacterium]
MNLYKRFSQYLKPYLPRFIQAGLAMTAVALLTTATIWLIRTVVDQVLIAKNLNKLFFVAAIIPLIYLAKGIFSYIQNYLMNYISHSVIRDMRSELYSHLQNCSLDFFHQNSTGQLMSRLTHDTTTLQNSIAYVPVQVIRDGLTVLCLLFTILYLNWKFALITLFLLPIAMIPVAVLGSKMRKTGRLIQKRMADLFMLIQEGITGNCVTKVFSKEKNEIERFNKENQNYYASLMRWVRADVLGAPIMEFVGSFAAVFLLWYGGKDVINGAWSTGSFFSFLGASISAYKPIKEFTGVNARIQQGLSALERVFELLDQKPTVTEKKDCFNLPPFSQMIQYQNVGFSYETNSRAILKNITLDVHPGEIVAIVGPSGAGKTTLIQLLPRLFDPTQGSILIDGTDIKNVTFKSLRGQIGMVTQDTILFNETVRYNLAYGSNEDENLDSINLAQLEEAASIANAHPFIQDLPEGYDTQIGEKGVRLSGGQRQRLAIARAILKNPPILILDEATSSLDSESEKLVQEALERLMKHRTVLVVAHRLSTIRKADRIIVLENGEIIEEGRHETLLEKNGLYKKLYETQYSS